jgi:predicted aspartyl protease
VVELVDAPDSKSGSERSVGSIPTARTNLLRWTERHHLIRALEGSGLVRLTHRILTATLLVAFLAAPALADCRMERVAFLPVTFSGSLPTVPVRINGHEVAMLVDTGSTSTLLSPDTAASLHLLADPNRSEVGLGTTGITKANNVFIDKLEIGSLSFEHVSVPAIPVGQTGGGGVAVAGLLGGNTLADYDMEYDVPGRTIALYRMSNCRTVEPPWQGAYATMKSVVLAGRMIVPVLLDGYPVTAVIDTGAERMSLAKSAIGKVGLNDQALLIDGYKTIVGVGGTPAIVSIHRFGSMTIGGETFQEIPVVVQNFPIGGADMLLGEQYMQSRRFWFSYATGAVLVQPAAPAGGAVQR